MKAEHPSKTLSDQPHDGVAGRFGRGVQRLGPAEVDEFREFQRRRFGERGYQADDRFFDWRFNDHPYRPAAGPLVWICRRDGRMVGQQAALPFSLEFRGLPVAAAWAIDLMVDPEWRLRGVGPALNAKLHACCGVVAGLGISPAARRSLGRAGWIDLGRVQRYVRLLRPLHPGQVPTGRKPVSRAVALASRLGAPILRLMAGIDRSLLAVAQLAGLHLDPIDRFDPRVDGIGASPGVPLVARRDFRTLNWRFDAAPDAQVYRRHYFMQRDQIIGYVVLRRRQDCMMVVDYLCPPSWHWALFAFCLEQARTAGASTLHCLATAPAVRKSLTRLGFLRRPGPHFMVYANDEAGVPTEVMSNLDNWFLTEADSDLDHTPIP